MPNRLLVVDDAAIIRAMISDAAQEAGWEVVGQGVNGKEGAELHQQFSPDVTTLDLVMPEYDGLYALRTILKNDPEASVVVVSALDQKNVLEEAFKLGAADFLVKPFDKNQLVETLNQLVAAD